MEGTRGNEMPGPRNMRWILVLLAVAFDFWNTLYKGPPDVQALPEADYHIKKIPELLNLV